jgi:hypothetical protein
MTDDNALLDQLQRGTFNYFQQEANEGNGLVADCTKDQSIASIAAVGLALTVYPVAVERGFLPRAMAVARTLATLRFFWHSAQSTAPDATGYKGFYYHFLDMQTGRRVRQVELSTIDTAILLAGVLAAAAYFDQSAAEEEEIRQLADDLYRRTDWQWAMNKDQAVSLGWTPETGFYGYRWRGYNEALLLYILGLGSPTHPLPPESYQDFTDGYRLHWKRAYDKEMLYAGSLFIHQLPQVWVDLRGVQDDFMRAKGSDYFENSRLATRVQQAYAMRNPFQFNLYGEHCWGFTASEGPGLDSRQINGIDRYFFGYEQRGAPFGPDDGTIAPWVAVASLPFAPDIVLPTIRYFQALNIHTPADGGYGFKATFNATYQANDQEFDSDPSRINAESIWVLPWYYGLNQGPIILMIENYRTELIWRIMRRCPYIRTGLRRAGFRDGWLETEDE